MGIFNKAQPISNNILSFERKVLLKKISEVTDLPIPNVHLITVIRMMRDENVKIKSLVEAIQKDQTLVAKILKLVNSGLYGLKAKVDSVEHAVGLLGIENVKQIVYSASVMDLFSDEDKLEWTHAYSSSLLMENILKNNDLGVTGSLAMAMLLHDIGKVVLKRFSPQKYKMALHVAKNEKIPVFKAEEMVLQITHAEAGSVLMDKWEMEDDLVIPVMYHHREATPPDYVVETALIQLVNWVDCSAREILCPAPSHELLTAAGIDSFDKGSYVNYQRQLICQLNAADDQFKRLYGLA